MLRIKYSFDEIQPTLIVRFRHENQNNYGKAAILYLNSESSSWYNKKRMPMLSRRNQWKKEIIKLKKH